MQLLAVFRGAKIKSWHILILILSVLCLAIVSWRVTLVSADEAPFITENVVINEVFPATGSGEKWIELYNPTLSSVNISGWRFVRGSSNLGTVISSGADLFINPGGYYVHSFTTSLPLDGGTNPLIELKDGPSGNVIDSVEYEVAEDGQSYARTSDAGPEWSTDSTPTKGTSNNEAIDNTAPVWDNPNVHVSPEDNAVVSDGSEIIMQWSSASDPNGVKYYYLVSSVSPETSGPENRLTSPIPWLFGPFDQPTMNATGTAPGTYYWQVKACDDLNNCTDWTDPFTGTVTDVEPAI